MTLSPGTRLGPYEVLAPLGSGAMGEVYRARDTRLEREVAVKVLPASFSADPDRLRRFDQEARAASALNHPNILAIYDVGTHDGAPYVVSELLEGGTLRERLGSPLPARKAVDYGIQIAQGLAAAHEKGIVHRDLKPENLFVTKDGRVKILDFGLAKLTRPETAAGSLTDVPTLTAGTEPGVVMGTVGYMSPEQVRGQPADHRSDIFAFGSVLYEMLSGRRAFRGSSAIETMSAILKEEPPELSQSVTGVPPSLERIVRRCLEKDPAERFQSARDLAFASAETTSVSLAAPSVAVSPRVGRPRRVWIVSLAIGLVALLVIFVAMDPGGLRRRLLGHALPGRVESLAVLPLHNLSGDPGQEYFAEGMTDALIANLAEIGTLRVISRTSVEQYKDGKKPLRQIARELGVDAVVEGSVARSGDRVRITAQLIHGASDTRLWGKTYHRDLRDILELEGEVASAIAREIEAKMTPEERLQLERRRPIDARAYEAYLQGRFFLGQESEEGLKKAFEYFQKALQIEPNYAAAYSGLASYHAVLPFHSQLSPAQVFPQARAAAQRAVELDERLAEAHASLAYIRAYYEWDWAAAEREFRRALELRPSYADAHFSYSRFLAASGRMEESMAEIRRARELDPMSAGLKANVALLSYFGGRYDQALAELLEMRKLDPDLPLVHWGIGLVYEQKGMHQEAIASIQKASSLSPTSLNFKSSLGHAYAVAGRTDEARAMLNEVTERSRRSYVPSYFSALVYGGLEEKDRAFEWLERAYQERSTVLAYLQLDPRLANLRGDPRFSDLLRRVGHPPAITH